MVRAGMTISTRCEGRSTGRSVRGRRVTAHHPSRVTRHHPRAGEPAWMPDSNGGSPGRSRRERTIQILMFALGGLAALFSVLNLDEVEVNWIVGTWETPLIVVMAVNLVLGAGLGYFVARRARARVASAVS